MPVPDLLVFGIAGGVTMLTSAISIGCLIARDRMAGQRDEAREEAERWKARFEASQADAISAAAEHSKAVARLRTFLNGAEQELALYRAAEPARIAASIKQHYSDKAVRSNRSPVRAAKRAEKRQQKAA